MTQARRSHEGKTLAEKQEYFQTTIRGKVGPTVDERTAQVDSTETTIAPGPEKTTPAYRRTRTKKRNRYADVFRENWGKALVSAIAATIFTLIGWALRQTYSLNREIGELKVKVNTTAQEQSDAKTDLQRFEDWMTQELDRINDRLDRANRH